MSKVNFEIDEKKTNKQDIINHVKTSPFLNQDDIFFGTGYEMRHGEDKPKFGAKMNEYYSFWALYHEISHAIEIVDSNPERVLKPYFGMGCITKVEVMGEYYDQYITTQAIERECRVFAIEAKLIEYFFGLEPSFVKNKIMEDASSLYLMNDFFNIKVEESDNLTLKERENIRLNWVYEKIEDYYNQYKIEDLVSKFKKVKDVRNYKNWSIERLLDNSFHYVDVKQLGEMHNPFAIWPELETPITVKEVQDALKNNEQKLCSTPSWVELEYKDLSKEEIRKRHIQKIAYFVVNPPKEPITIDVGFPEEGIDYIDFVEDGNHRLAGSLVRGRDIIKAKINGSTKEIKNRLLYGPNVFLLEAERKINNEIESKINTNISLFFKEIESSYGKKEEYVLNKDLFNKYCNIADKYHDKLLSMKGANVERFKSTKIEYDKGNKIRLKIRP